VKSCRPREKKGVNYLEKHRRHATVMTVVLDWIVEHRDKVKYLSFGFSTGSIDFSLVDVSAWPLAMPNRQMAITTFSHRPR